MCQLKIYIYIFLFCLISHNFLGKSCCTRVISGLMVQSEPPEHHSWTLFLFLHFLRLHPATNVDKISFYAVYADAPKKKKKNTVWTHQHLPKHDVCVSHPPVLLIVTCVTLLSHHRSHLRTFQPGSEMTLCFSLSRLSLRLGAHSATLAWWLDTFSADESWNPNKTRLSCSYKSFILIIFLALFFTQLLNNTVFQNIQTIDGTMTEEV